MYLARWPVGFVIIFCAISPATGAPLTFSITDLGTLGGAKSQPRSINNSAQIVGLAMTSEGVYDAFIWSNGIMTDLGGNLAAANGINNAGQISGTSKAFHGFFQSGDTIADIPFGQFTYGFGINSSGVVVGYGLFGGIPRSYSWSDGTLTDLGTLATEGSQAASINDKGQIAGGLYLHVPFHTVGAGFLLSDGQLTILSTLGGGDGWANAINNNGQIVGQSSLAGDRTTHACIWYDGGILDLGTAGWKASYGNGINNNGQVVGTLMASAVDPITHAFLYSNGINVDLNDLIPADTGWILNNAYSINDAGQIVGDGINPQGLSHAFLLSPLPEPAFAGILFTCAGALFSTNRRRRERY